VLDLPYSYVLSDSDASGASGSRDLGSMMNFAGQFMGGGGGGGGGSTGTAGGATSVPGITAVDNRATLIAHALAAGKAFIAHDSQSAVHEILAAAQDHFAGGGGGAFGAMFSQISGGGGFLGHIAQQFQGRPGLLGTVSGMFAQGAAQQQQQQPQQQDQYQQQQQNTSVPQQDPYQPQQQQQQPQQQYQQQNTSTPQQQPPLTSQHSKGHLEAELKPEAIHVRTTLADVVQFSGCRNDQTSADAFINGQPSGALSYAFVKCMNEQGTQQTYSELLVNIRTVLQQGKYSQVPQLSTGAITENLDSPFFM